MGVLLAMTLALFLLMQTGVYLVFLWQRAGVVPFGVATAVSNLLAFLFVSATICDEDA
ncbi:hypothetical protein [Olsenella sp. HMSC062G07]|uniref:hypothetical protein n=1 Tax=Olsenella sp. HMSC062G07 TaxID=1739330 RepID=UPI000A69E284|nr:hypothetical protein [Olsenella sp. HMSC062G07]